MLILVEVLRLLFQSTLSARRATIAASDTVSYLGHFNPRSPRGERQQICIIYYQFRLNYNMQKLRNSTCFPTFT